MSTVTSPRPRVKSSRKSPVRLATLGPDMGNGYNPFTGNVRSSSVTAQRRGWY
jgi:hypothetical protein